MGYVGCVSGACLARLGHRVIGVEPNPTKVELLNSGKSPIVETGLDILIAETVQEGKFSATSDWKSAVADSEMAIVCVGTPSRANGSIDLKFVVRVCEQIGQAIAAKKDFFSVVIRSTVLPGTVESSLVPVLEEHSGKKAGVDFGVAMNPEFLREGTSIFDFHNPPKTVIGELNPRSGELLAALYQGLPGPTVRVPIRVAEMVKYVDNTFHALKVTFANEVGNLSKELGVDSHRVMEIFCLDTKLNLSPYYLKPGFAFGGSCLPKDLRAITSEARMLDVTVPLLSSILESNRLQIQKVTKKLLEFKGKSLGFLGFSFKGGTDDLRESPIVEVIEAMLGKGFDIKIYDRHVSLAKLMGANKEYIQREIPHISRLMCAHWSELMAASEVIIVANRDEEFKAALAQSRPGQTIIDLVRIVDSKPANAGSYYGICW
jgi:GDP-mannose 6-dehydrogenase